MERTERFLDYVYQVYESMREHEVMLVYEGEITHQVTKAFTSLAEHSMLQAHEEGTVQKKVFHVMVECLQNITKHAEVDGYSGDKQVGRGIFLVRRVPECYQVIGGNLIESARMEELRESLDHINSLDREALNVLYKEQMRGGQLSEKGGAGLGFIDIARKTGERLLYHFRPVDERLHFFIITSTISRLRGAY